MMLILFLLFISTGTAQADTCEQTLAAGSQSITALESQIATAQATIANLQSQLAPATSKVVYRLQAIPGRTCVQLCGANGEVCSAINSIVSEADILIVAGIVGMDCMVNNIEMRDGDTYSPNYNPQGKYCSYNKGTTNLNCETPASGFNRICQCEGASTAVDGGWTSFGQCSKSCGTGTQSKTCTNPSPANGGDQCNGPASQDCNTQACPTRVRYRLQATLNSNCRQLCVENDQVCSGKNLIVTEAELLIVAGILDIDCSGAIDMVSDRNLNKYQPNYNPSSNNCGYHERTENLNCFTDASSSYNRICQCEDASSGPVLPDGTNRITSGYNWEIHEYHRSSCSIPMATPPDVNHGQVVGSVAAADVCAARCVNDCTAFQVHATLGTCQYCTDSLSSQIDYPNQSAIRYLYFKLSQSTARDYRLLVGICKGGASADERVNGIRNTRIGSDSACKNECNSVSHAPTCVGYAYRLVEPRCVLYGSMTATSGWGYEESASSGWVYEEYPTKNITGASGSGDFKCHILN